MSQAPARMSVLVGERFACVKIEGRANFSSSIDFRRVLNELRDKGYNYFVLDLSECALMDSTFLGVLAGFGLKTNPANQGECGPAIELRNPNARITELLENLGVLHLFQLTHGESLETGGTEGQPQTCAAPSREEVTRACLEAHQTLMQVNPQNASKFKDVAKFLAEDLKKLKPPS